MSAEGPGTESQRLLRGVVEGVWKTEAAQAQAAMLEFRADGMVATGKGQPVRSYRINGQGMIRILNGVQAPTELQLQGSTRLLRGDTVYGRGK